MPEFIFMLTCGDCTVTNAIAVHNEVRQTGLRYVGFKDIGLPFKRLKDLARSIRESRQEIMLEVVSERREDELRSVKAAIDIGVDYLLGGVHAREVTKLIAHTGIRYFPFAGRVVGHPSKLRGSITEIVDSARELTSIDGVHGIDLLAYRYDGDIDALVQAVVKAVKAPVIAAGSIDSDEKISALSAAGVWGFTIGSAIFNGTYPSGDASIGDKISSVLQRTKEENVS
jgi:hypothetical protein